ncbi:MAG: hypothetical protein GX971_08245 [Firmicutes bacterium]|nr:hypothetical protein [Bacillota bacterium]
MRNQLVFRPYNLTVNETISKEDRQVKKFFTWEKHPRQKNKDYSKLLHSPLLFL